VDVVALFGGRGFEGKQGVSQIAGLAGENLRKRRRMMGIFDFLKRNKKKVHNTTENGIIGECVSIEPDFPRPFGYKICWYAVKNEDPQSVMDKLGLKVIRESNWKDGLDRTYGSRTCVFVSPQLDDYVLVVGVTPDVDHNVVKKHALSFDEIQYFGTHRVSEYCAYAKFENGKMIRCYCYVGDMGEVTWCEGNMTPEEMRLGFDKFPQRTDELLSDDFDYDNIPDEESILSIAKAWGIDTTFESKTYEKGTGFICQFPA